MRCAVCSGIKPPALSVLEQSELLIAEACCAHMCFLSEQSHAKHVSSLRCAPVLQELQALGEAVGTVSRGLPAATAAALPRSQYSQLRHDGAPNDEQ
jgi:hypothetical protein